MDRNSFNQILKNFPNFVLKKDLKYKQIKNALEDIAPDIKENDLIALYDTGTFKNGKNGYVISKDAIYYNITKTKIPFKDMDSFAYRKESSYTFEIKAHYIDGHEVYGKVVYSDGQSFADLILAIAGAYNMQKESTAEKTEIQNTATNEPPVIEEEPKTVSQESSIDPAEYNSIGEAFYDTNNYEKAYEYLIKAADLGHARSINLIGLMYKYGEYLEKNHDTAFKWFQRAADLGYPAAYYNLALYYKNEKNDSVNAAICYEKGANLGYAGCQNGLGLAYEYGRGVTKDEQKAVYWYQKAADQDHKYACYNLGYAYRYGAGIEKDYEKALFYFEKAANQNHSEAQYSLGYMYKRGIGITRDFEKGLHWLKLAADNDHADACYEMGHSYYHGYGVEIDDTISFSYFLKSAELGNTDSQGQVAICYETGKGTTADLNTAMQWYHKAADNKDMASCANLARVYRYNFSDFEKAVYWYKKAYELDHSGSCYQLGVLYETGEGVVQDLEKALSYYEQYIPCCKKNTLLSEEEIDDCIAIVQEKIKHVTELINQKNQKAQTPSRKMPLATDLVIISLRNDKLYNKKTLATSNSLSDWAKTLGKRFVYEYVNEFDEFADEILAYIGRNAMTDFNIKIAVCAYCSYLDRYPEIKYSLPVGAREECKKPGLNFQLEEQLVDKAKELQALVENHMDTKNPNKVTAKSSAKANTGKPQTKNAFPKYNKEYCVHCEGCKYVCPVDAIVIVNGQPTFNKNKCMQCEFCVSSCPGGALSI